MTGASQPNPTVARRELAVIFRALRERQKRSLEDLAAHLDVALSQASRLDTGARGFRPDDVRKLASWYRLGDAEETRLLALATESRKRAWWQQVDLPNSYRTLIGMEQAAVAVNEYCSSVVPGLLQTPEYARAATAASVLDIDAEQIDPAVDVRLRRQSVLSRTPPPQLWVVIDEAALARVTGGRDVMRAQLEHLRDAAARRNIVVQVIGFEYGTHPGGESHFILLDMAGDLPDVVYTEGLHGPDDSSAELDIRRYRRIWDLLRSIALNPRESSRRIASYAQRLAS